MILAALLLSVATQPGVQADPLEFDLRCLVAAGNLRNSPDPNVRAASTGVASFFFGRVDVRLSEVELQRRLAAESTGMAGVDLNQLTRDCGAFMSARGEALIRIGQRISATEHGTATQ
jgi:hypothetical protein